MMKKKKEWKKKQSRLKQLSRCQLPSIIIQYNGRFSLLEQTIKKKRLVIFHWAFFFSFIFCCCSDSCSSIFQNTSSRLPVSFTYLALSWSLYCWFVLFFSSSLFGIFWLLETLFVWVPDLYAVLWKLKEMSNKTVYRKFPLKMVFLSVVLPIFVCWLVGVASFVCNTDDSESTNIIPVMLEYVYLLRSSVCRLCACKLVMWMLIQKCK